MLHFGEKEIHNGTGEATGKIEIHRTALLEQDELELLFVGCLTSQQHASVSDEMEIHLVVSKSPSKIENHDFLGPCPVRI